MDILGSIVLDSRAIDGDYRILASDAYSAMGGQ